MYDNHQRSIKMPLETAKSLLNIEIKHQPVFYLSLHKHKTVDLKKIIIPCKNLQFT